MPPQKPPRLLPKVVYDPPFGAREAEAVPRHAGAGMGDYSSFPNFNPATGQVEYPRDSVPLSAEPPMGYNPMNYFNPSENVPPPLSPTQRRAQEIAGGAPQYIQDAFEQYYQQNPNGARVDYPNRQGSVQYNPAGSMDDRRPESRSTAGAPTGQATDVARTQDAVSKNQRLTEEARNTGNDKELARLQAEWDRIAPKAAKYGITAERLVNSYMQPGNSAAESSLDRALGRAIADDTWANAASIAFGRPPNQVEWREHWEAMNRGGRDPLEGHPAAIQAIQAKMKEIEQENQNEAFSQYQSWLANQ